jgi:ketosteroid isomerase-like protein
MNDNQQLITRFYGAFQRLEFRVMQDSYHDEAIFFDPVFENLNSIEVKAMWEMLCKNARNFSLQFSEVQADEEYGSCKWVAHYTFSQTGREVTNQVKSYMRFHDGKIVEHTDHFDLWKWSRQALGPAGWLLGWSGVLQKKVHSKARANLLKFMGTNAEVNK